MIKEYLDYKKASKIQDKISSLLPTGVECVLTRSGYRYKETELKIQNSCGAERELSRIENDMKELINIIFDTCKRFHLSFTFHSHGLDYVYISIKVK
jgi:hypothetical protein